MILCLIFNSLDTIRAAPKNPEKTSVLELTFTGTGPEKTEPFTVDDGWEIRWETESSSFKLSAHGSAKRLYVAPTNEREEALRWFETKQPIVLANSTNKHGTAIHPLGGTFYLQIVANGQWSIHLQTIKDTKDYLDVPYTGAP